jgi:tetratricopeptide (TPR) repeat protein
MISLATAFVFHLGVSAADPAPKKIVAAAVPEPISTVNAATEVTVAIDPPAYDGFQMLLESEARDALAKGNYPRAWNLFWRLTQIDPYDLPALRECGRIAHAMGKFPNAVDTLGKVDHLQGGLKDPELHYLRGEALLALGRKAEAEVELRRAERELGPAPEERRGVMWLARIAALRGDLERSLSLYRPLYDDVKDDAGYAEVTILIVEANILSKKWGQAETLLRGLLHQQPDNGRAREMLAWVLDSRGKLDEALALRAVFSEEWTDHPRKTLEYAQTLERAYDYPTALERYRHARWLGVADVEDDVSRLERRLAPELGGGLSLRDDPSGDVTGWSIAGSMQVPGTDRYRIAVIGSQESTSGGVTPEQRTSNAASAMVTRQGWRGSLLGFGASVRQSDLGSAVGGTAVYNSRPGPRFQVQARADYNLPWRESSSTIREDGVYDAAGVQLYYSPFTRRLLLSAGAQGRRLGLDASGSDMDESPRAHQLFGFAGADFLIRTNPTRAARGEILDAEMLAPRVLASSTVLSYRHYELFGEDPFGSRLVLVDRSMIDELSAATRHILDDDGVLGAELRGGIGFDWERDVRLWRAGASAMVSPTARTRLSLDYDLANESRTGLSGRRHIAQMVLHVDL